MVVEKRNFHKVILTREEEKAFEIVNDILYRFQSDIFESAILESQISGELVEISELGRVRGVLSFFTEIPNQIFEVKDH